VGQAARRRVVEQTNEEGMTPLMIAARSGCFETFELLLQARTLPPPAPRLVASPPCPHARQHAPWHAARQAGPWRPPLSSPWVTFP
jgi:ankyrin repeat protein